MQMFFVSDPCNPGKIIESFWALVFSFVKKVEMLFTLDEMPGSEVGDTDFAPYLPFVTTPSIAYLYEKNLESPFRSTPLPRIWIWI